MIELPMWRIFSQPGKIGSGVFYHEGWINDKKIKLPRITPQTQIFSRDTFIIRQLQCLVWH